MEEEMKYWHEIRAAIIGLLVVQLAFLPRQSFARQQQKDDAPAERIVKHSNLVVKLLRKEVEHNSAFYYPDTELGIKSEIINKEVARTELDSVIERLEDDSYSLEEIKSNIIQRIHEEEQAQFVEMRYIVKVAPVETLNQIFEESLKNGFYPETLRDEYEMAYGAKEKRAIVLAMIKTDFSRIKSNTVKRLGFLDREALLKEMQQHKAFFEVKGRDTWKMVLVVILTAAVAGYLGWAIMSSTKKRWDRKIEELEEDYDQMEEDLRIEYQNREAELRRILEERARLRDEGYIWTICSTRTEVQNVSCSYDYNSYSGAEVCVTRCLKNPSTGDSVYHSETCSSSFIPNNCFLPNPYDSGWDDGYDSGYNNGYNTAYDRAYWAAYYDEYDRGYDAAYDSGYNSGYNSGFSDGYAEAEYDDRPSDDDNDDTDWDGGWDDDDDGGWDDDDDGGWDDDDDGGWDDDDDGGWDDDDDGGWDDGDDWDDGWPIQPRPGDNDNNGLSNPNSFKMGFQKGYREGYSYANQLLLGL
jgi:hypothetical protein